MTSNEISKDNLFLYSIREYLAITCPLIVLSIIFTKFSSHVISSCNRFECKKKMFPLRDRAVAMSNMGVKLKVTPCLKCLNHCYDNERRPVEECNSKKCRVALSLRDTICPSEWSSGVHDWTMWSHGDAILGLMPFISQEPLAMWVRGQAKLAKQQTLGCEQLILRNT